MAAELERETARVRDQLVFAAALSSTPSTASTRAPSPSRSFVSATQDRRTRTRTRTLSSGPTLDTHDSDTRHVHVASPAVSTATVLATAAHALIPGGAPPLSPLLLLRAVPQLVRTATRTLWSTSSALVSHLIHGPPHASFSWQTTAVRAILRSAMQENPPAHHTSFVIARQITQFTYPTSPHGFEYRPAWFVFDQGKSKMGEEVERKWIGSCMVTEEGQKHGYAVTGEYVSAVRANRRQRALRHEGRTHDEDEKLILYVHGGAFHFLSARTHRCITSQLVTHTPNAHVLALHQRLAPEHSFAAAVEDVILVYLALIGIRPASRYSFAEHPLANLNATGSAPDLRSTMRNSSLTPLTSRVWRPDQILFSGDSSGGNTATSALLVLKEFGLPLPGAAILLSPWLDPPSTSASWTANERTCYLPADLPGLFDGLLTFCRPLNCTHPFVSPLYATRDMLRGLPPVLIQVGGGETLYDEAIEWGACLASVGGHAKVEVFEGAFHVWHAFVVMPEQRRAAFERIGKWVGEEVRELRRRMAVAQVARVRGVEVGDGEEAQVTRRQEERGEPGGGRITTVDMAPPREREVVEAVEKLARELGVMEVAGKEVSVEDEDPWADEGREGRAKLAAVAAVAYEDEEVEIASAMTGSRRGSVGRDDVVFRYG
ncbi:Alpha/Beta hydrolase protein [Catenaria anguillulae PL171]|uniref:Alpha/Beta hydrolase protein n=1 Tax=Catenaria anguillulae PL171 TaxID=765915 RepID=A0A1Y2HNZ7_9FUNG|nr:Alpha/Beta hydrolase protein [Catenaria anguillulae PL171]